MVKCFLLHKKTSDKCSNSYCVLSKCGMKCGLESHKTDGNDSSPNKQRSCEFAD